MPVRESSLEVVAVWPSDMSQTPCGPGEPLGSSPENQPPGLGNLSLETEGCFKEM